MLKQQRNHGGASVLVVALAALFASFLIARAAVADFVVSTQGSAAGQTRSPWGVAVDPGSQRLYVADTDNDRIDVFTASTGAFLFAFGWGVADGTTPALQTCTTTCFPGLRGPGTGQFREAHGIAADSSGAYVVDFNDDRVEKFGPAGEFIFTVGGGVNQTTGGNLCPVAPTDVCGPGTAGAGPEQFSSIGGVAIGPEGNLYVADQVGEGATRKSRVQKYTPAGAFVGEVLLAVPGGAGGTTGVALDPSANIYLGSAGSNGAVRKYDPAGVLLSTLDPSFNVTALAVDGAGNVFVADNTELSKVLEYSSAGTQLSTFYGTLDGRVQGLAIFHSANGDVFASEQGSGRVVQVSFPPPGPLVPSGPEAAVATNVGPRKATLHSRANPEGQSTSYYFEYVDQEHFEEAGFASPATKKSTPNGTLAGADFGLYPASAEIAGLTPETTYHFRLVVLNAAAPAGNSGPTGTFTTSRPLDFGASWSTEVGTDAATLHTEVNPRGDVATAYFEYVTEAQYLVNGFTDANKAPDVDGGAAPIDVGSGEALVSVAAQVHSLQPGTAYRYRLVASDHCKVEPSIVCEFTGPERTLQTLRPSPMPPACPNQGLRPGAAAFLPDCRGYEMVSPVDKNGGSIEAVFSVTGYVAGLDQSAGDGHAITYSSYKSFGANVESAPYTSQYIASRTANGWLSESISPPRQGATLYNVAGLDYQFKGFTDDLCFGWPRQDTDLQLAPGAIQGYPGLYRRRNCEPGEGSYEVVTPVKTPSQQPRDFKPELQGFSADGSVAVIRAEGKLTENATAGAYGVYEVSAGQPKFVCVLPNGSPITTDCSVGTPLTGGEERNATLAGAVSANGSRVYWTEARNGPGKLFVRIEGKKTVLVSESPTHFWDASLTGSKAIYSVGDKLFVFDLASETSTLIAEGVRGVAGASDDLGRIYLTSSKNLASGATAGAQNLYLYEGGSFAFVATLPAADVTEGRPSPVSGLPVVHTSRVTPDGGTLVFVSTGSLTGYDNIDANSGKEDAEVFRYAAGEHALSCISCNPTYARPVGREWAVHAGAGRWAAATIPAWQNQLYGSRVVSDDGSRVFFNSIDRLLARDTNGKQDVYQWEEPGSGDCDEDAPSFQASSGGCLSLISSGESPQDSELVDSDTLGDDVFFKTASSLYPSDPGLIDVYDARVGGGFPLPPPAAGECEGEACQSPPPTPESPSPASAQFSGPGNPVQGKKPKHRNGRHKKKHRKRKGHRPDRSRGAAR